MSKIKVKIWPMVKESYAQVNRTRAIWSPVVWLPLALIFVWYSIFWFFPEFRLFISTDLLNAGGGADFFDYWFVFETFMTSVFMVALYRFFILDEKPDIKYIEYKKGIPELKTVFKLPYYFRFGRWEFVFALFSSLLGVFFLLLQDVFRLYWLNNLAADGLSGWIQADLTHSAFLYTGIVYFLQFLELLVYTVLVLVFPFLALHDSYAFKNISEMVKAVKGNIFRILIIVSLIYLPYDGFNSAINLVYVYAFKMGLLSDSSPFREDILFHVGWIRYYASLGVYYVCVLADIIFLSIIYKRLVLENDKN